MSNNFLDVDALKVLDEIFKPDPRMHGWCDLMQTEKPEYLHQELQKSNLRDYVPQEIVVHFDMSRNVFLYSFYQYRMAMLSQLYALVVLEKSLKFKKDNSNFADEKIPKSLGRGLRGVFFYGIEKGWISDDAFGEKPLWPKKNIMDSSDICKRYISNYASKRNELAHNPESLNIPWDTLELLTLTSQLINYIFSKE